MFVLGKHMLIALTECSKSINIGIFKALGTSQCPACVSIVVHSILAHTLLYHWDSLSSISMKVFSILTAFVAAVAATPTPTVDEVPEKARLAKRASISDKATLGYATQNGG